MLKKITAKTGFTLIELLVVISIIAILMSILLPALGKVRRQGKLTMCRNNIRQICMGLSAYATDYNGRYPKRTVDLHPVKVWSRGDDQGLVNVFTDYVLSNVENSEFSYCPLRDKKSEGVLLGPGLDHRLNIPITEDVERISKFMYVKNDGYFIGYSIYAGLPTQTKAGRIDWYNSGNSITNESPKIYGSSKDAIVADFVQLRTINWYSPHAEKATVKGHDDFAHLFVYPGTPTVPKAPKNFGGANVGYGDGRVEFHKETTNYIDLQANDRRLFAY